jgi:NAD(P)-dependent dehydrogenase (short-subunit alcohol dehydrogenase family)
MASYLITGGTRGLGLAMVKLLLEKTAQEVCVVIATFRSESPALHKLALENRTRLHAVPMDVTDPESIRTAKAQILGITTGTLDVLINNAGVMTETREGVAAM